jgi:uncharacterized protein YeaO (DUF488 family)
MVIQVVRLGTARLPDEGTRIGTVRRPPRGVPKAQFAAQNWYDVWFPTLAPSAGLMKIAQAAQVVGAPATAWATFVRKYRVEMAAPEASHAIRLLATLSKTSNFSVGCYCVDAAHCHRSVLTALLTENGAQIKARY